MQEHMAIIIALKTTGFGNTHILNRYFSHLHWNGLTPLCVAVCTRSASSDGKRFRQYLHSRGFGGPKRRRMPMSTELPIMSECTGRKERNGKLVNIYSQETIPNKNKNIYPLLSAEVKSCKNANRIVSSDYDTHVSSIYFHPFLLVN